jgi:hypothetical protein
VKYEGREEKTTMRASKRWAMRFGGMVAALVVASATQAQAQESAPDAVEVAPREARDAKGEAPIVAYTYQATGTTAGTYGAQGYGLGSFASGGVGDSGAKRGIVGGGLTLWGSPVDRLTLVADAARDATGNFAPSAAAVVRLFGRPDEGLSLGAIGKFKVEGFGVGRNNEMESEVEGGLLLSFTRARWHLDLNAITGFGTGDDGEIDTEGRLRIGREIGSMVRVGVDGQARYRLAGDTALVGGRKGDFTAGPQVMIGSGHFFGALTAGPTTTNVFDGFGWSAVATVGGATL